MDIINFKFLIEAITFTEVEGLLYLIALSIKFPITVLNHSSEIYETILTFSIFVLITISFFIAIFL